MRQAELHINIPCGNEESHQTSTGEIFFYDEIISNAIKSLHSSSDFSVHSYFILWFAINQTQSIMIVSYSFVDFYDWQWLCSYFRLMPTKRSLRSQLGAFQLICAVLDCQWNYSKFRYGCAYHEGWKHWQALLSRLSI